MMKKRLLSLLLAICLAAVLLPTAVYAESTYLEGDCGEILSWQLDNGTLTIGFGKDKMPDFEIGGAPWYSYREEITSVVMQSGVLSIGSSAFADCVNLTSVTIPDAVTSIGESAFSGCEKLTSITIPDAVNTIGNSAFADCINLTSITIPDNVTTISDKVFDGCKSLENITIPDDVTSIGESAFSGCEKLTSITFPDTVTEIQSNAFLNCKGLKDITFIGSAPTFGKSDVFGSVTATAYYPDFNTSWTEGVMQDYGGNITWEIYHRRCGENLTWELKDNTLTISGTGAMKDYGNRKAPWNDYRSDISSVVVEEGVTSIGKSAFFDCINLTSITIPDSVTEIRSYAFCGCTSLPSITIPDTVTSIGEQAFYQCTSLASVTIPEGVTVINYGAFQSCTSLTSITIPGSVTDIRSYAFQNCNSLTKITFNGNAPEFSGLDLFGYITATAYYPACGTGWTADVMKDYGGTITWESYDHNIELKDAKAATCTEDGYTGDEVCTVCGETVTKGQTIPGGHQIEDGICTVCLKVGTCGQNLTWTLSDDGVLTISGTGTMTDYAPEGAPWYRHRDAITSVVVEEGVTSIGKRAFCNCSSLTGITLPDSLTFIGADAFNGCSSLTSITIPEGVTIIDAAAFRFCDNLTGVTIPDGVTNIGTYAFGSCTSLTSINVPAGVTSIGDNAFVNCSSLNGIWVSEDNPNYSSDENGVLFNKEKSKLIQAPGGLQGEYRVPDGVISIENYAFHNCGSLTGITIPDSVTGIGSHTFQDCDKLPSITIPGSVTSIGSYTFSGCSSLTSITFDGNAPRLSSDVFYKITVTVYYPACSIGWTEDVRQNYGGTITWESYENEHTWGDWAVIKAPTCTEEGEETRTCAVCGKTETESIPPLQQVSTKEELIAAIDSGAIYIQLTADITVNEKITLSNKEIILDLNGHVLKNSSSVCVIQLEDGASKENTALTLIDSNPTATHENLPYKGGVIDDGIIVTTAGTGDNDCRLYANGGSVTGSVNLASYASSIRCTSDTPTAFYGNASQYGEIYGGIFYGNTSLKTIKNPTLTFRYNDGNIYAREVLEAGKNVIALENPTKTGYTFTGWDKEIPETMPEDDLTVTAQWTANEYAITYEGMDGVDEGQNYPDTHTYDTETVIPNPTKAGYTFNGWKVNGGETPVKDLTLGATDYTDDITLTAVWEGILCTVRFDANGGSGEMADVTVAYGSYTLPECEFTAPEGKQFKGWATSANGEVISGTTITVTEDTTLYAIWENIPVTTYTVSFDANGGTGEMADVTVVSGDSYTLPECEFTAPEGKQFKGWATSADGEVISDTTITVTGDTTLYAIWSKPESVPSTPVKPSWKEWLEKLFDKLFGNEEECEHEYTSVVTEPTCEEKGYTTHTCTKCGDSYKDSYTDALGHDWDEGEVTKEATCTEDGEMTFTCETCGKTKVEKIDALGHKFEDGICTECGEEEASEPENPGKPSWDNFWDWLKGWWN